jgi:hypothetical protein
MKYIIKNLIIDVLPKPVKGKGERDYIPESKASPRPCWTTSSTCWCTCGGCSSLTHPGVFSVTKLSRHKNIETALLEGLAEVRRRQRLLQKASTNTKKVRLGPKKK